MSSPFGRLVLIANPLDGDGRIGRELPALERALLDRGLDYRLELVDFHGGADAGRRALEAGERFLVAVGGDRIVHEVANGLLGPDGPRMPEAVLGVVAAGLPNDFIKTFGLPADTQRACGFLEGDNLFPIDAIRATCTDPDGGDRLHHVVNLAQAGVMAASVERAGRLPNFLGRTRRFLGFWLTMAVYRPVEVILSGDRRTWTGKVHGVVVANGQYTGDGIRISPRSWPSDGYLDILVMKGPKSDAFTLLPRAYRGEHLPHPNIIEYRAKQVRVETARPLWIEADGLVLGRTPATFEVVPGAIRLKI